jgi:hypothetical protein
MNAIIQQEFLSRLSDMKITEKRTVYETTGFCCDVCMKMVMKEDHDMTASLSADFGYGSQEDGNKYHLDLCESCFKTALIELKKRRRDEFMFDEEVGLPGDDFGKITED